MKRGGFTLVELLIGMALFGVILVAALNFSSASASFSSRTASAAHRLRELTDVSGYLGDNIRRASRLSTAGTSIDGSGCALTDPHPCFAMVVPEARAGSAIDTYLFLAYRLVPRSALAADQKAADGWADANTTALVEYRSLLCGVPPAPACAGAPAMPASATGVASVVADGLVLAGELPGPVFAYDGVRTMTMRLRAKARRDGSAVYWPADGVHTLQVQRRN